ncbi:MAG: response regulator [Chloroflexi bacterium]|nr:response regulator [Chloroflexota bacterium]
MPYNILLVDDQRDILRLLHSTLDGLKNPEIKIFEAPSGEEALLESARHNVDLLVSDYMLPGINGVELMHKVRVRHPEAKVILVTGVTDKKVREEIMNAGALAVFNKPIPLAEFLDVVERGLGLVETMFTPEHKEQAHPDSRAEERHAKLSDLLANFRQDIKADAVFLLNDRGLVQARTGRMQDDSMELEAALVNVLMSIHYASLKVARYTRQETLGSYHVFSGGDYDLLFTPISTAYALFVVGRGIAAKDCLLDNVGNMIALKNAVEKALKSIGMTGELRTATVKPTEPVSASVAVPTIRLTKPVDVAPSPEMEALLKEAAKKKEVVKPNDVDDFWNQAAEKHSNKPTSSDVLSLEEARNLGLIPGDGK